MLKRNTYIFYATQFLHSLFFTVPIWIVYYRGFVSVEQISLLVTVGYLTQMVLELPSGALADLIGRRNTNMVGFIVGAAAYLLFPFATHFWQFVAFVCAGGLSDSFRSGSEEALLYDTYKENGKEEQYGKVYARGNFIYQTGLVVSAATGGVLYGINHGLPYYAYGLSLVIATVFIYFYIEPHIDTQKFGITIYVRHIIEGTKEAFRTKYTTYLSLFYIFVGGIAWSSTTYFNDYLLVGLGFRDSARGYIGAFIRILNMIIIMKVLQNKKLFTWTRTILFFPIIMVIAYLPGIFMNGWVGVPFIQGAMIATTARWIILSPVTNAAFSSRYRATAISLLSLLIGFVYVALTSISGPIISTFGIKTMYTFLGVATFFTIIPISYKLLKEHKKFESNEIQST